MKEQRKTKTEYLAGADAFENFQELTRSIVSVPKEKIDRKEREERAKKRVRPKRGIS